MRLGVLPGSQAERMALSKAWPREAPLTWGEGGVEPASLDGL